MTKQINTVLNIQAKLQGQQLTQLVKQFQSISQSLQGLKALNNLDKVLANSAKSAQTLAQNLAKVNQVLQQQGSLLKGLNLGGGGGGRRGGAGGGAGGAAGGGTAGGATGGGTGGTAQGSQKTGPFMHGLIQGLGVQHIRRQGTYRQLAGRAFGRGIRSVGGLAAGGIFGGPSGFAGGLGGIPYVGGLLAGQFQMGMSAATDALGVRESLSETVALGLLGEGESVNSRFVSRTTREDEINRILNRKAAEDERYVNSYMRIATKGQINAPSTEQVHKVAAGLAKTRRGRAEAEYRQLAQSRELSELSSPENRLLESLRSTGEKYGFGIQAANKIGFGALSTSGISPTNPLAPEAMQTAIAAQRLGISSGTVGMFGRALNRGTVVGMGTVDQGLTSAIKGAIETGFESLADAKKVAETIGKEIGTTLIQGGTYNLGKRFAISSALHGAGFGPEFSNALGQGFANYSNRLSINGPQGADFGLLAAMGSLRPGMSPKDLVGLMTKAGQQNLFDEKNLTNLRANALSMAGGDKSIAALLLQRELSLVNGGNAPGIEAVTKLVNAGDLKRSDATDLFQGVAIEGKKFVPNQSVTGAEQENRRILDVGMGMIQTQQRLVDAQLTTLKTTIDALGGAIDSLTSSMNDAAQYIRDHFGKPNFSGSNGHEYHAPEQ